MQGQGTASLVGFGATPQQFLVKPTQRKKSTRRRQRSVPASNFARPQTRPPSCFIDPLCSVAPNGRDHIACPPLSAQTKPSRRISNILRLGFQSCLTPLLHICHIPNSPRKHQQLPGRKTCEKKCERDRKPSSVEGRSSIQTWRCRAGSSDAEDATGSRMCPHTHLAPDGVYSTDKSPSRG